ncbi:hypothetical protein [Hymenobacter sp. B81]|uniref:hypothetical protein n=1 Tax=Hymenobacter sp. B81 TaxID=3344878 RepID=UPI0037DC61E7
MTNPVLQAKHWQIFLLLAAPTVLSWFVRDELVSDVLALLTSGLVLIWLGLLGNSLYLEDGPRYKFNVAWFLFDVVVVLVALAVSLLLASDDFHVTGTSIKAKGWAMLPMLYVLFARWHTVWLPAALLVAIEQKRRPSLGEYTIPFLLLANWPIGIWFIQPRINRLYAARQADSPEYSRS